MTVTFFPASTGLPWAAEMTGDGRFPHNGRSEADVTISSDTTWDETDYPGRLVQLDTLTVNAGITLTLEGGPWFLFIDEIVFGDTDSHISGDGPNGSLDAAEAGPYARGGWHSSTAISAGGSGGVMVFICAREISGAAGVISANGGDATRNTSNAAAGNSSAGQGALAIWGNVGSTEANWTGNQGTGTNPHYLHPLHLFMGDGGRSGVGGAGGGTGSALTTSSPGGGGGSGIGGGGGAEVNSGSSGDGLLPYVTPGPAHLLALAELGCLGGGGGGAGTSDTGDSGAGGASNCAGGGGGGSVCAWVRTLTATPTLEANGGTGTGANGNGSGGEGAAGVAYLITVP